MPVGLDPSPSVIQKLLQVPSRNVDHWAHKNVLSSGSDAKAKTVSGVTHSLLEDRPPGEPHMSFSTFNFLRARQASKALLGVTPCPAHSNLVKPVRRPMASELIVDADEPMDANESARSRVMCARAIPTPASSNVKEMCR